MPIWPLLLSFAPPALAGEPMTWREAVRADTSAAYLAFAAQNLTSPKASVARRRAEDRAWQEAVDADSSNAYRGYVQAFPTGAHVTEAATRAVERAWEEASASGSLAAMTAFLERYPSSEHGPEARARVEELWFDQAQSEGTEAGWTRFLLQYPKGARSAVAWFERDRLAWERTVAASTRSAYERYLAEIPAILDADGRVIAGAHRQEAELWLAETYVRRIVPLVALVDTWHPSAGNRATLEALTGAIDRGLLADLRKTFTVLPARAVDATRGMEPAQQLVGTEPGTGILVFEVHESKGEAFDPDGVGTNLHVVVRLYAPNTAHPVVVREVRASTPRRVRGLALDELHKSAIGALADEVRVLTMELAAQAPRVSP